MAKVMTSKTLERLEVKKDKITAEVLTAKIGRSLGSPINSKAVGEDFDVTLTGVIEIREFDGRKSAYFLTKEGYSISVNASFDPSIHVANKTMKAICNEFQALNADGSPNGQPRKYCSFVA